ncbi:hypothetical protein K7432_011292 [Basidiobolus ranarum]|uniref:Uncharacterized protein n=1 Tax=Basidiobolus ranarum TaxID=34480 RepID=A0ABR2VU43_9FUNG
MVYSNPGISALAILALLNIRIQAAPNGEPNQGPRYNQPFMRPPPPGYMENYYNQYQDPWRWSPYVYGGRGSPQQGNDRDYMWGPPMYDLGAQMMPPLQPIMPPPQPMAPPLQPTMPPPQSMVPPLQPTAPPPQPVEPPLGSAKAPSLDYMRPIPSPTPPPAIERGPSPGQLYGDLVPGPITGIKVDLNTNELKNSFSSGTFDSIKQRIRQQKILGNTRPPPEVNTENVINGINILSKVSVRLAKQIEEIGGKATEISRVLSSTSASQKKQSSQLDNMLKRVSLLERKFKLPLYKDDGDGTRPTKPIPVFPTYKPSVVEVRPTPSIVTQPMPSIVNPSINPIKPPPMFPEWPQVNWNKPSNKQGVDTNILTFASRSRSPRKIWTYERTRDESRTNSFRNRYDLEEAYENQGWGDLDSDYNTLTGYEWDQSGRKNFNAREKPTTNEMEPSGFNRFSVLNSRPYTKRRNLWTRGDAWRPRRRRTSKAVGKSFKLPIPIG